MLFLRPFEGHEPHSPIHDVSALQLDSGQFELLAMVGLQDKCFLRAMIDLHCVKTHIIFGLEYSFVASEDVGVLQPVSVLFVKLVGHPVGLNKF